MARKQLRQFKLADHFVWIDYWTAAHMVNIDQIQSLDDMRQARSFCSCLSRGLFWDISDEQMWNALQEYRNQP